MPSIYGRFAPIPTVNKAQTLMYRLEGYTTTVLNPSMKFGAEKAKKIAEQTAKKALNLTKKLLAYEAQHPGQAKIKIINNSPKTSYTISIPDLCTTCKKEIQEKIKNWKKHPIYKFTESALHFNN